MNYFYLFIFIILFVIIIYKVKYYLGNSDEKPIQIYETKNNNKLKIGILGGVHGNEPAGCVALTNLIESKYFENLAKRMDFVIIPCANPYGLKHNKRHQPDLLNPDLNRNFGSEDGDCPASKEILKCFKDCDLVLDFHEGWGFHKKTNDSIGSSINPTETKLSQMLAKNAVETLNSGIVDPLKQFTLILDDSCDIPTTLRCHFNKKGRNYILIETTGQDNIQPIEIRTNQIKIILDSIFFALQKNED